MSMFNAGIPQRHATKLLTEAEVKAIYRSKPEQVQIVLKAFAVKLSLVDRNPDWADYVGRAIEWWQQMMIEVNGSGVSEIQFASALVEEMRNDPFWGKVLRERTN